MQVVDSLCKWQFDTLVIRMYDLKSVPTIYYIDYGQCLFRRKLVQSE